MYVSEAQVPARVEYMLVVAGGECWEGTLVLGARAVGIGVAAHSNVTEAFLEQQGLWCGAVGCQHDALPLADRVAVYIPFGCQHRHPQQRVVPAPRHRVKHPQGVLDHRVLRDHRRGEGEGGVAAVVGKVGVVERAARAWHHHRRTVHSPAARRQNALVEDNLPVEKVSVVVVVIDSIYYFNSPFPTDGTPNKS